MFGLRGSTHALSKKIKMVQSKCLSEKRRKELGLYLSIGFAAGRSESSRASSTLIAVARPDAEGGAPGQFPNKQLRGTRGVHQTARDKASDPRDLAGACSGGKLVVRRPGEAYDAQINGPNRQFC